MRLHVGGEEANTHTHEHKRTGARVSNLMMPITVAICGVQENREWI